MGNPAAPGFEDDDNEALPGAADYSALPATPENMPDPFTYVDEAFGDGGWLSKAFPSYKPRPGQVALADQVAKALLDGQHLLAEGPTGTGKSFAYSIPAIYHAVALRCRVVIVTANIALQEQLVKKDLPALAKVLPFPFHFALLKGKSNYLCKYMAKLTKEEHQAGKLRLLPDQELISIDQVLRWSKATDTGDLSELTPAPVPGVWSRFSVSSEDCLGPRCEDYDECFAQEVRKATLGAHVIVTNYHVLFASMNSRLLPAYNSLILDEGHKMVDIAREFFGFRVTPFAVKLALSRLPQQMRSASSGERTIKQYIENRASFFFEELYDYAKSPDYSTRIRTAPPVGAAAFLDALQMAVDAFRSLSAQEGVEGLLYAKEGRKVERMAANVKAAMNPQANPESVFYLEVDDKKRTAVICSKRFDVAKELADSLFGKHPVVLTSATLSVGGAFDHLLDELGLPEGTRTFEAESPFDLPTQARLIVPENFPEPNNPRFQDAVAYALIEVVKMAKGRTLALFTSWNGLKVAKDALLAEGLPYTVYCQGDAPRTLLVEQFLKDRSSVLLGVESFWQGVDVPGDSLSCVVIDKLPFPHRNDPVLDALEEQGNAFRTYSIPRAIIAFKQGFGRLIRTTTDRGVVVLLDSRIHTKWGTYGKRFIQSLAGVPFSTSLDDVERFLESKT